MKNKILLIALLAALCLLALCLVACDEEHVHVYGEWAETTAPTCDKAGVETRSCACGESEEREVAATGVHSYGPWTETKKATCGAKGERMRLCSCGHVDKESIFATNEHLYGAANVCALCNKEWEYTEGLVFELTSGGAAYAVCGNDSGLEDVLTLPYYYNGLPVTTVNAGAFRGNPSLTEVVLPDLVTTVCANAFAGCSALASVTFETNSHLSVIGERAFAETALTEFTIGADVIHIGDGAFADCNGLAKFVLDETNIRFYVGGQNGSYLVDVASKTLLSAGLNGSVPADGRVTAIAAYAFSSTSATSIVIPETVTTLAPEALAGCVAVSDVTFRAQEGWGVSEALEGPFTSVSVADAAANKTALADTYSNCYWKRTQPAA